MLRHKIGVIGLVKQEMYTYTGKLNVATSYHPQAKLQDVNVFTGVCHSRGGGVFSVIITHDALAYG